MMSETLIIEEKDVKELLEMKDVVGVVESAFREKGLGNVEMPPKPYIYYPAGDLRVMPAYIKSASQSGVKVVTVFPRNREKNLPTVMACVVLVDVDSGVPLSVMGGTWLTAMRTGAAGGVASNYLARKDSKNLAFVGTGVQAYTQLMAHKEAVPASKVYAFDMNAESAGKFAEFARSLGLEAEVSESGAKACENADILITTTPVTSPVVENGWIREGMHINAIGADAAGKKELDPEILKRAKIIVDDWAQASHSGEINVSLSEGIISRENIRAELGEVVAGKKPGRESDSEITVFDSTGLAIQDVATASLVYRKALDAGKGLKVRLAVQ